MIKLGQLLQFLLIALIVVGIFAAMARNAYGFELVGVGCLGIAVLFLFQVVWKVIGERGTLNRIEIQEMAELLLLAFLTLIFGLRSFYIYVDYSEIIFNAVCVFLMFVYAGIGYTLITSVKKESKPLAWNLISFYSSLVLFLLSTVFRASASLAMSLSVLSVVAGLLFIVSLLRRQRYEIKLKSMSLLQFVIASRNKAGLLFLFFVSAGLFTMFSYVGIIPSIENADRPKDYVELINSAGSGKKKSVDGKYQHEKYKEAMDKFMERHGNK